MEFGIELVTPRESRRIIRQIFRFLCFLLGFTVGAVCAAHGQDSADLQKELEQLKAQYEQSTQQMQQRITALEQQIQQQNLQRAKEQADIQQQKSETVSALQLAAQATEKSILGQSNQVGAENFKVIFLQHRLTIFCMKPSKRFQSYRNKSVRLSFTDTSAPGAVSTAWAENRSRFRRREPRLSTALATKQKPMRN